MPRMKYSCPWRKPPVAVTSGNVVERSELWLDQVMKKAMLNRHHHVLVPLGDDFRWDGLKEADAQFDNYQPMFDYLNDPKRQARGTHARTPAQTHGTPARRRTRTHARTAREGRMPKHTVHCTPHAQTHSTRNE
jgi:hypothetical protein